MLSIIIPVAPDDQSWSKLLALLEGIEIPFEVILVASEKASSTTIESYRSFSTSFACRVVVSVQGRARQLNYGASQAKGEIFWFVHCDSDFDDELVNTLEKKVCAMDYSLYYFDLGFFGSAPWLMKINEWGVYFRSHSLKMPFGDQGFLMLRQAFEDLKGFDETCLYGEDHLLIWNCHRLGIKVKGIEAKLYTSSRKYEEHGWLKVTATHFIYTWRQAIPQIASLVKEKWKKHL